MYHPVSCELYDQIEVVIQRKIPSTIEYIDNEKKETSKGLVQTMTMIDNKEFLILNDNKKIRLDLILTFNGKRYKKEKP